MKNIILFDNETRNNLLPLTYTRPVCELRVGILTIREKWEKRLKGEASFITEGYLSEKYDISISEKNYLINGSVLPSPMLVKLIEELDDNEALLKDGELIAAKIDKLQFERLMDDTKIDELEGHELAKTKFDRIRYPWDIFTLNDKEIKKDFDLLTKGRNSARISESNKVLGRDNIFLEKGAKVEFATLNASAGPIYIGKNAEIMEGALIRGGFALCEGAVVKMGAKIYGATTIGPYSKVGGEISNSVLIGYSNKGHDGYLGNSVLGEWCNLGADTNVSNLKNNYAEVKVWNYDAERFLPTGLQFAGVIMGDHSKTGINTMLNTGTVIGVFANIFGSGFPRNFIPSFSWGGAHGFSTYKTEKAFEVAEIVMKRRKVNLTPADSVILLRIFELDEKYRRWENQLS